MKTYKYWLAVPTALVVALTVAGSAQSKPLPVAPGFQPDPQVLTGTSGGAKSSDCGYVSNTPSQVIQVTQAVPYLRFAVQSEGQPTLLIDGPGGRFCSLADTYSQKPAQISGFWSPGTYSVYVGDRGQGQHAYRLSISQAPN
ncbi:MULTISPECIES: hypothetical protein [Trichocoleus]|uniref:Uncharacterized protein n=1 Tax=Trichocoleus desertorum GB2-A4 TaxID=2933944 RepID=A0ABV0JDM4_9CYAN|nr:MULTISPECIES: hypothetical protein [unclassified Trichocoleus]MBD1861288.1 hypothetical protein [Trichocoleus sp. FACHB-46]MBD2096242.1 hypothetical protein [Trichocoleus sp. FACHB-591]